LTNFITEKSNSNLLKSAQKAVLANKKRKNECHKEWAKKLAQQMTLSND